MNARVGTLPDLTPTSDGTRTFVYGDNGRMKRASKAGVPTDYLYNGRGERISKAGADVTGGVQFLAFDVDGKVLGEYSTVAATPVMETAYLGTTPVVALSQGTVRYVFADHIDTARVLTSSIDNAIVWRWDQADPFGTAMPNENPVGAGTFAYNLRFPGQVYDRESGLHYNYYRDYDPQTGRYVQSDPIGLEDGINTYGYVGANPLQMVDPLGLAEGSINIGYGATIVAGNGGSFNVGFDISGALTISKTGFNFSINLTKIDSAFGAFIGYGLQSGAGVGDEMCKGYSDSKSDWLGAGAAIPGRGGVGASANLGPGGVGAAGSLKAYGNGVGVFGATGKTTSSTYSVTWGGK
jgi:RHS repeat-associated protein